MQSRQDSNAETTVAETASKTRQDPKAECTVAEYTGLKAPFPTHSAKSSWNGHQNYVSAKPSLLLLHTSVRRTVR
jgi:hypothetical protein